MPKPVKPIHKMCRWLGEPICTNLKCPSRRRPQAPGVHGPAYARRKRKVSEYGTQLLEKQKAKVIYGMRESQFRRFFDMARKVKGATDTALLTLLERRLDNVIFRAGFATTRNQARQLANHGHFLVNGHRVNVPSILVRTNDEITVRRGDKAYFTKLKETGPQSESPAWIVTDRNLGHIKVVGLPGPDDLSQKIDARKIVELYSK